ncbi:serine-rich adhesin for platelets isoform X3 [Atheta coriaria]|uniref:serine-rich adhesin for platelets isoform X3 n=1 Tax=Dalotia coriaria TaxID=877792 RepID=UPI0031F440ED
MDNYSNLLMDECPPDLRSPEEEIKPPMKKQATKGVATSFGFRKKPTSAPPACTLTTNNPTAARRLANATESVDSNGNTGVEQPHTIPISSHDTASLTSNAVPSGKSTPHRLPAPKKEAQATTKPSRFGFRQPNANRLNRVADININPPTRIEYANNNQEREQIENEIKAKVEMQQRHLQLINTDSNKNVGRVGKYTLQTNQLPRPQPIKLLESKTAKTLANNSKKQGEKGRTAGTSGDESYFTEDSGVGSNCGDNQNIKQLEKSPMSRRIRNSKFVKPRTLEVIVNRNTFDVRDVDDNMADLPVPTLSSFSNNYTRISPSTGNVRDRAAEYQRNVIDKKMTENRCQMQRKNSFTSSEASSHCEEDQPFKRLEKIAKFIKKPQVTRDAGSSDDQMWSSHAGEAMAEEFSSVCNSSSDESRDKVIPAVLPVMEASIESLISAKAHNRLSLVDPTFAAIAASNISVPLIADEPSPVDSINCSSSSTSENHESSTGKPDNDKNRKMSAVSSDSKDINEKNTPSSPGSPTNASNSLSLSDGREDFLIDDEIADQPALLFDDTITNSNQPSEATSTIVDSTPKASRRAMGVYESSPLSLKNRRLGRARAGSLDTLSPCESIASDDCMMDYDMSSGVEDANDRTETNGHFALDDVPIRTVDLKITNVMRDWSSLLSGCDISRDNNKRMSFRSSRLLKSRGGTPASSVPDSPRSDVMRKTSVSQSPLRLSSRSSTGTGYDSDDSAIIRLDRSILQDVIGLKTGLLKLKRVLHEPATEDYMLRSETHNSLSENGFFNGYGSDSDKDPEEVNHREEMENLRRQVVYLQGQLDDSERTTQTLRQEIVSLSLKYESSQSAPSSVTTTTSTSSTSVTQAVQVSTCNAATQTERIRPISAGPTLLQDAANDLSPGSLVSVSEQNQTLQTPPSGRSRHSQNAASSSKSNLQSPGRLWRMPGEPASPSAIPRRSSSRSRIANTSLTATSTTTPT